VFQQHVVLALALVLVLTLALEFARSSSISNSSRSASTSTRTSTNTSCNGSTQIRTGIGSSDDATIGYGTSARTDSSIVVNEIKNRRWYQS
jgi:hypothetical protein